MAKVIGRKFIPRNEQIVLSHMMASPEGLIRLSSSLSASAFLENRHRTIFVVLQELVERRLRYSVDTFEQLAGNRDYGGRKYVSELADAFGENANVDHHVEAMRVDTVKASALQGPLQLLVDLCEDPTAQLDQIRSAVHTLGRQFAEGATEGVQSGEALGDDYRRRFRQRLQSTGFVPTGIGALDKLLTLGLKPPGITVITGRPAMGKTTVGLAIADHVANVVGRKVLYCAFEGSAEAALDMLACARTGTKLTRVLKFAHKLRKAEVKAIQSAVEEIASAGNLVFREKRIDLTTDRGKAQLRLLHADIRPELTVYDLFERTIPRPSNDLITEALAEIEDVNKDYGTHSLLLHQQKRATEMSEDKRPTLSGLKNSGAYEEFADNVIGLYRDKYYDPRVKRNVLEAEILKQRRGEPGGVACVEFAGDFGRIGAEVKGWIDQRYRFMD